MHDDRSFLHSSIFVEENGMKNAAQQKGITAVRRQQGGKVEARDIIIACCKTEYKYLLQKQKKCDILQIDQISGRRRIVLQGKGGKEQWH